MSWNVEVYADLDWRPSEAFFATEDEANEDQTVRLNMFYQNGQTRVVSSVEAVNYAIVDGVSTPL